MFKGCHVALSLALLIASLSVTPAITLSYQPTVAEKLAQVQTDAMKVELGGVLTVQIVFDTDLHITREITAIHEDGSFTQAIACTFSKIKLTTNSLPMPAKLPPDGKPYHVTTNRYGKPLAYEGLERSVKPLRGDLAKLLVLLPLQLPETDLDVGGSWETGCDADGLVMTMKGKLLAVETRDGEELVKLENCYIVPVATLNKLLPILTGMADATAEGDGMTVAMTAWVRRATGSPVSIEGTYLADLIFVSDFGKTPGQMKGTFTVLPDVPGPTQREEATDGTATPPPAH